GLPAGGAGGVALDPGPPARGQPRCDRFRAADPGAAPRGFLHPVEGFMAAKFQGVDFYNVDGLLSEEERAVRDTVRAWVDDNLMPVIAEHYLEGRFPKHLVPQMAELGLFGANLPEEYGCAGLNHVAYGLIMQELDRARGDHLGEDRQARRRGIDPRLHRPDRHAGLLGEGPEGEAVATRQRHQRAGLTGCVRGEGRRAAEIGGLEVAADVPHAGTLRHRVGSGG